MKKFMLPVLAIAVSLIGISFLSAGPTAAPQLGTPEIAGSCPFDGFNTQWNGRTQIINAKIWYEMRCVNGHITLSPTAN